MLEVAQFMTRRMVRATHRVARTVLGRLGLRQAPVTPHKPVFSDRHLALRLGIDISGDSNSQSNEIQRLVRVGARRARVLFGPRFFVEPERISDLSIRLEQQRPTAVAMLMQRVRSDLEEGLLIYGGYGERLGPDFSWRSLARGPGNDSMYAKRPHRFAFAPRHAWACLQGDATAVALRGMLEAWMRHAATGVDHLCYDSNLAVIQRLLALSWAWAFLAARPEQNGPDGLKLEWLVLKIIEADMRFLEPLLGQSAPNNHLLADRFASWYLVQMFPELLNIVPADAERLWCEELLAQTYADGGNFEHSSHYHEFSCEMTTAYLILSARNARIPDPRVRERTKALLAYQCALTGPETMAVPIGNAVEDTLFPLDAGEAWCSGSLREIYRALFDSKLTPADPRDQSVIRAFWMLAGDLVSLASDTGNAQLPSDFLQAGLHILADASLDARLLFRTGPAPDTVVAAGHMHADLLAVYLHVNGYPLLVDAGTYTYRGRVEAWGGQGPNWRHYFAGPAAHNGFTRDGEDPLGLLSGDFRRRDTATRVITSHASNGKLSYVNSTLRSSGVYNRLRRVCVHVAGEYWLILNELPNNASSGEAAWFGFQLAPATITEPFGNGIHASLPDSAAELWIVHCDRVLPSQVLNASQDPLGGWVSPRYGERLGAPQLRFAPRSNMDSSAFLISVDRRYSEACFVQTRTAESGAQLLQINAPGLNDWIVYQPAGGNHWVLGDDELEFDGLLLWMRFDERGPILLRWLEGSMLQWPGRAIKLRARNQAPVDVVLDLTMSAAAIEQTFAEFQWAGLDERR